MVEEDGGDDDDDDNIYNTMYKLTLQDLPEKFQLLRWKKYRIEFVHTVYLLKVEAITKYSYLMSTLHCFY